MYSEAKISHCAYSIASRNDSSSGKQCPKCARTRWSSRSLILEKGYGKWEVKGTTE